MKSCPACGENPLRTRVLEAPAFRAEACERCGGMWVSEPSYRDWMAQRPHQEKDAQAELPVIEPNEVPMLRKCPACASILGRYRVGHGVPFTIDRCYHCRGVWLDRHEWDVLRARDLVSDLYAIFTDEWQSEIRRRERDEKEEAYRRRVLGDDGVERLNGFIAWANGHPKRHLILGLLLEGLRSGRPTRPTGTS
jgi:Zn-finger nucleic acid-binding protein